MIGVRADMMVDEIYEDLQNHIKLVRSIPSDHRSSRAKQVQALYDICRMGGVICSRSSECVSILNLSGLYVSINPFSNDAAVQNAVRKIKNNSDFFASECVDMIQQAADWSISFAAGSNEKKRAFLEDISQGKGKDFLQEVLDEYRSSSGTADTRGRCGYSIGSRDYRDYVERTVFRQELPTLGSYDYDGILKGSLEVIADQLERDLTRNERENNYITDDTARNLKEALRDLNRCDVSTGSAESTIERLAWFVGGDPAKIRQLQSKLNELGIGERLEEDGVYGIKTFEAWTSFLNCLDKTVFPTLKWINPLRTSIDLSNGERISFEIMDTEKGVNNSIGNAVTGQRYYRIDEPHYTKKGMPKEAYFRGNKRPIDYNHINVDFGKNPTKFQAWLKHRYNHYPLTDDAYDAVKNLQDYGKQVRVAGRKLLMAGLALDVLELGLAAWRDLTDADRTFGKPSISAAVSIGGRWVGSIAGAKIGAAAGLLAGPAAPVVAPMLSIVGSFAGSFGGDALGQYIVDITVVEE